MADTRYYCITEQILHTNPFGRKNLFIQTSYLVKRKSNSRSIAATIIQHCAIRNTRVYLRSGTTRLASVIWLNTDKAVYLLHKQTTDHEDMDMEDMDPTLYKVIYQSLNIYLTYTHTQIHWSEHLGQSSTPSNKTNHKNTNKPNIVGVKS